EVGVSGQNWIVDDDYISTFGIKILEGRNFNMNMPTDSAAVIVNQKMVKELNLKNPIGSKIRNYAPLTIIAVVEDFIFGNMHNEDAKPLALVVGGSPNMMSIRLKSDKIEQSIDQITGVWNKFSPHQKIQYTFLDEIGRASCRERV